MGANFLTKSFDGTKTKKELETAFVDVQDQDRYENGHSQFGDDFAMADIEGRRLPEHSHDYLPDHWDKEPWFDDPLEFRQYQERQLRRRILRGQRR
ncbi:hypothetical protein [Mesorhizobium sp. M7A.F.Ca.CA.002.12.1.1]|uniref:hypothetical protein n=1 Tax=Mesorhizobium sp. M7A.F.Ca.CA.002.12.1.1 TaxID=2496735 RepID=UPI000FCAA792|nr:hypothetical protein [Mesorhizobium sp. M7A.F.Ca.CA.002.12.1.1]RUX60139.1 hypothetical protein EN989_11000 [Mesorhizobium sp. M7A.F.Ca.CA.002.12.1.1]